MKKATAFMTAVILFLLLSFSVFAKTSYLYPSSVITDKKNFHVVAHRGLNSLAPENSLSAFRLAGEYGFWGCEFDIYPTTDGKWAVMHDPTIDRMTNGSGSIMSMSYEKLLSYHINTGTNIRKYSDEKIPELEEVLDICKSYGMRPVIEIKGGSSSQIADLCDYLSKRSEKKNFVFTSFSNDTLKSVREKMKNAEIWLLTFSVNDFDLSFARKYKISCIDTNLALTTKDDIEKILSNGFEPGVWTADSTAEMEKLWSWGVRTVTTNSVLPVNAPTTTQRPTQAKPSVPTTTKPQSVPSTQPVTDAPPTTSPQGYLNNYLSQEDKATIEIVYKESKKVVGIFKILFN